MILTMSLANGITIARGLLIAPILLLLFSGNRMGALSLFLIACAGDVLDGLVARARKEITTWGKVLDPTVDKALYLSVLSALAVRGDLSLLALTLFLIPQLGRLAGEGVPPLRGDRDDLHRRDRLPPRRPIPPGELAVGVIRKLGGDRSLESDLPLRLRVLERDPPGVEEEALRPPGAVDPITDDRMADVAEVNPDLMRPAGYRTDEEERPIRVAGEDSELRLGRPATRFDRHPARPAMIPADRGIDHPLFLDEATVSEGDIGLIHPPGGELSLEAAEGGLGLRHDDDPTRLLVEPVDDPRPGRIVARREIPIDKEPLDERRIRRPGAGMDDQSRLFVHDDDLIILEQDIEGEAPGAEDRLLRYLPEEALSAAEAGGRLLHDRAGEGHPTGADLALDLAP